MVAGASRPSMSGELHVTEEDDDVRSSLGGRKIDALLCCDDSCDDEVILAVGVPPGTLDEGVTTVSKRCFSSCRSKRGTISANVGRSSGLLCLNGEEVSGKRPRTIRKIE